MVNGIHVPAVQHFNYDELTRRNCQCDICQDWQTKLEEFHRLASDTYGHHRSCMCSRCRLRRRAGNRYYAALNRRDIYCELSFLMRDEPAVVGFFDWFKQQLNSPNYTDSYWKNHANTKPLATWLVAAASAVSGMGHWLLAG